MHGGGGGSSVVGKPKSLKNVFISYSIRPEENDNGREFKNKTKTARLICGPRCRTPNVLGRPSRSIRWEKNKVNTINSRLSSSSENTPQTLIIEKRKIRIKMYKFYTDI